MSVFIGVSGEDGSFSEEAAMLYVKREGMQASFAYLIDMDGVLSAITVGDVAIGIFPVVNLQGGLVKPAFHAMGNYLFTVVDEIWLEVNQCLLVRPGTTLNQITTIVSHSQGFLQCEQYLKRKFKTIERRESSNTATAARELAAGRLPPSTAVIASKRAAQIYSLDILAPDIQDRTPNLTAFIVVKPHE